ncbi:MAG: hypothetical protein SNJ52_02990 [Verrucomicrobiia bacterium]
MNSRLVTPICALFLLGGIVMAGPYAKGPSDQEPFRYGIGAGPYWGLHGGVNAYQTYEGTRRATVAGRSVALEVKEKLGGFGGLKFGYNFNGGFIRPALEVDTFYNGADFTVGGRVDGREVVRGSGRFDTGAFLVNGLLRMDLGGSFIPYVGVGGGFWIGQVSDPTLRLANGQTIKGESGSQNGSGLAAQGLAGFDYYLAPQTSLFTEYKWLNYFGSDLPGGSTVGQHLIGLGMRFNF